jgi:hypothetical protein
VHCQVGRGHMIYFSVQIATDAIQVYMVHIFFPMMLEYCTYNLVDYINISYKLIKTNLHQLFVFLVCLCAVTLGICRCPVCRCHHYCAACVPACLCLLSLSHYPACVRARRRGRRRRHRHRRAGPGRDRRRGNRLG